MPPLEFSCDNPQNTLHKHHRNLKPLETLAWIGIRENLCLKNLYPKKTPKLKNPKHLLALGCVDGSNGWQQQKQRMCIDQVQNQRTTKEESSCTMHMHFTCASLVVHIKLERSSCSLSLHVLLLSVPLSCTSLYYLYALSLGFLVW